MLQIAPRGIFKWIRRRDSHPHGPLYKRGAFLIRPHRRQIGGSRRACSSSPWWGPIVFETTQARLSCSTSNGAVGGDFTHNLPGKNRLLWKIELQRRKAWRKFVGMLHNPGCPGSSGFPNRGGSLVRLNFPAWSLRPDLHWHLSGYETGALLLCYGADSSWCGTGELHPHDLLGRQACWLLHQCHDGGPCRQCSDLLSSLQVRRPLYAVPRPEMDPPAGLAPASARYQCAESLSILWRRGRAPGTCTR